MVLYTGTVYHKSNHKDNCDKNNVFLQRNFFGGIVALFQKKRGGLIILFLSETFQIQIMSNILKT